MTAIAALSVLEIFTFHRAWRLPYGTISSYIRSRLPSSNPCHSNCEVGDIWRAGARCVDDLCEYPPHSARRPLRHRDRHAETQARRGDAAPPHLDIPRRIPAGWAEDVLDDVYLVSRQQSNQSLIRQALALLSGMPFLLDGLVHRG